MKTAEIKFDDFMVDFEKKEMSGNGMAGNGLEIVSGLSIDKLFEFSQREMNGNGI